VKIATLKVRSLAMTDFGFLIHQLLYEPATHFKVVILPLVCRDGVSIAKDLPIHWEIIQRWKYISASE
jgi:hypothetical protein